MTNDLLSSAFSRVVADDPDTAVLDRLCERLSYPVPKWRLVAAALDVCLDAVSTTRVHRMPDRAYTTRADLDGVYRSTRPSGPVFPPPGRAPAGRPGGGVPAPRRRA